MIFLGQKVLVVFIFIYYSRHFVPHHSRRWHRQEGCVRPQESRSFHLKCITRHFEPTIQYDRILGQRHPTSAFKLSWTGRSRSGDQLLTLYGVCVREPYPVWRCTTPWPSHIGTAKFPSSRSLPRVWGRLTGTNSSLDTSLILRLDCSLADGQQNSIFNI